MPSFEGVYVPSDKGITLNVQQNEGIFAMRKLLLPAIALLALAPPLGLAAATKGVDITRAGFTPNKVTIEFGDTVTWTNKDTNPHQVLADQAKFPTSPVLQANQTYSYTFTKSGT